MKIIIKTTNTEITFKAKLNGRTIGKCRTRATVYANAPYIKKTRAYSSFTNKHVYITWLGVDDEYQGKYVGTRLLYHALKYYSRRGYRYVTLQNASERSERNDSIYDQIGLNYVPGLDGTNSDIMIGNIRHILYGKFRGMNGSNNRLDRFYRRNVIVPLI